MQIGIRELRDNLSQYVRRARDGETITVTDHGKAVARLIPLQGETALDRLVAEGKVTPAASRGRSRRRTPKPIETEGTVSDLVAEQRR